MLEARLKQAELLKKVLDAIKELVTDANFDCSDEGIKLQAMDNSHVALVSLSLNAAGFEEGYRCDRNMSLGMNLGSLQKIIKCAGNNDTVTLRADESADVLGLMFENNSLDRVAEFEMKLMDIDQEHLGIPDTVYDADISLPAVEFARIIRDLKELGESVRIEVSKEGIRFSCEGDIASASVTLKHTTAAAGGDSDEEEEDAEEEDDDEEEEPVQKQKKKKVAAIKDDDEDEEDEVMVVEGEKALFVAGSDDEKDVKPTASSDNDEEDEEAPAKKQKGVLKRKQAAKEKKAVKKVKGDAKGKGKPAKKEDVPKKVTIQLLQTVNLTFSIKYLSNFAKSTPLSDYVTLHMSNEVPLLVEYPFAQGHIRYYLAPKIDET